MIAEPLDANRSNRIDFSEFLLAYNQMADYLRLRLTTDAKYELVLTRYRERFMEARSRRTMLAALVRSAPRA